MHDKKIWQKNNFFFNKGTYSTMSYASSTAYLSCFVYDAFHNLGYDGTSKGNDCASIICQWRTFYWTHATMSGSNPKLSNRNQNLKIYTWYKHFFYQFCVWHGFDHFLNHIYWKIVPWGIWKWNQYIGNYYVMFP